MSDDAPASSFSELLDASLAMQLAEVAADRAQAYRRLDEELLAAIADSPEKETWLRAQVERIKDDCARVFDELQEKLTALHERAAGAPVH